MADAWQQALGRLSRRINKPTFEAHIKTLHPASLSDSGEVVLVVPSAFTREWIAKRHLPDLVGALGEVIGGPVTVHLRLAEEG